jgi:hypothetical protein
VLWNDVTLDAVHDRVALPEVQYFPADGGYDGVGVDNDRVRLSDDRRTLFVRTNGGLDSFRVVSLAAGQAPVRVASNAVVDGEVPDGGGLPNGAFESDTALYVLPESFGVSLMMPLLVDGAAPGTYGGGVTPVGDSVASGTSVDSVLLRFDTVTEGASQTLEATITFDRRIVGFAARNITLDLSDETVDTPFTFPDDHELELDNASPDTVELLGDRRSLYVNLQVLGAAVDDLRVFLEPASP